MNLAQNISDSDVFLQGLTESLSDYFISSSLEDIPNLESLIANIINNPYISYSNIDAAKQDINEVRYFLRKTEKMEHRVLLVSFYDDEYYYLTKDDGSFCVSNSTMLWNELRVHLRILEYNHWN